MKTCCISTHPRVIDILIFAVVDVLYLSFYIYYICSTSHRYNRHGDSNLSTSTDKSNTQYNSIVKASRRKYLTLMWSDMFTHTNGPWGGNLPPGIYHLPDKIAAKFQRLHPLFDDGHSNGTNGNTARCNRKWKIQDGGL